MPPKITTTFYIDGKQAISELNRIDGILQKTSMDIDKVNIRATSGFNAQGGAVKSLALRFVGYNLVLGQVMNAQQKLIQYVTDSVSKFREFQTRIAEVSTIMTGDYQNSLTAMKSGIESLALATGQATSDLTKGLYDIMSAAFEAQDAMNLLNTATKASIAGLSDVRTSVDIFTTVLNSYGMSVYEATKVSDTLFQSVVRGKFQFSDLESALGYVVPIASQAGIAFDELMAALSTATRHGLHLDMAARGLALALQNVINPSAQAAKAAEQYGIELSGLALRIKGIEGVFSDLNAKTKEYGKIVLNEIIPNMRSLRVAMVLAGDEGLEGLLDDMERLSVASGRTEEAFQKIAETSQFASNQITQQWEQTQREVGEDFDKLALAGQSWLTGLAKIMTKPVSWVPIIGPFIGAQQQLNEDAASLVDKYATMEKYLHKFSIPEAGTITGRTSWAREKRQQYPGAKAVDLSAQQSGNQIMQDYLNLQQEILDTSHKINQAWLQGNSDALDKATNHLEVLNTVSAELQDSFNRTFGTPILGGISNLEELQLTLEEIEFSVEDLKDELEKPIQYGWGKMGGEVKGTLNMQMAQLKADQELADAKYDVKMGTVMEDYEFKTLNADMQEAVRIIREHEKVTKQDTETINLMNIALRKVQIEIMELQLVGMMKRRGLSRQEERRMKQLQIQAAKLRLENMKNTEAETASEYLAYEQAKQMIDEYLAAKEHESYMLKYNYDQQIVDLQTTIDYEKGLLDQRKLDWENTNQAILDSSQELMSSLMEIIKNPALVASFRLLNMDINEMFSSVFGIAKTASENIGSKPPGFQRGTEYVAHTGLALVHQGETIGASGKGGGEGVAIGNVTIQVQQIADIGDIEKLGAVLSVAKSSQVIDKTGKTKYRLR